MVYSMTPRIRKKLHRSFVSSKFKHRRGLFVCKIRGLLLVRLIVSQADLLSGVYSKINYNYCCQFSKLTATPEEDIRRVDVVL